MNAIIETNPAVIGETKRLLGFKPEIPQSAEEVDFFSGGTVSLYPGFTYFSGSNILKVAPGIYSDIPSELYHKGPGISSSGIKLIAGKSLLHYWDAYENPEIETREAKKEKNHFKVGRAYHSYVLEPDKFASEFASEFDTRGLEVLRTVDDIKGALSASGLPVSGKKEDLIARLLEVRPDAPILDRLIERHLAEHTGKVILSLDDFEKIRAMAKVLRDHPSVPSILAGGDAEVSMYWVDADTGVLCKCRPDWFVEDTMIADLKTTTDASESAFSRDMFKYGYYISAAFYLDGFKACTGVDLEGAFAFIVQEKESPYAAAVYAIHDRAIEWGRMQYKFALEKYAHAMQTGAWSGYAGTVQTLDMPNWAYR